MLETSARLLRMLSLLETRRDWTGQQLAERLGVTTRTVRNDIERLRSLGYPVDATPGVSGGYRLGIGAALPPLLLDDDEAVSTWACSMPTSRSMSPPRPSWPNACAPSRCGTRGQSVPLVIPGDPGRTGFG